MKLRLIQKNINNSDYLSFLEGSANSGADIVCFGELAVSGCLYNGTSDREIEEVESITEKLAKYDFDTIIGLPIKSDDHLSNSYMYYSDRVSQVYNKINLFEPMNETKVFQAGTELTIFDTNFGKFGALICYDLRFPEMFSGLKEMGASVIFVPAAFPRARISDWRELLIQRAIDNDLTVIGINAVGDDGTNEFGGTTIVISPRGEIIAQADEENEKVLEVEL